MNPTQPTQVCAVEGCGVRKHARNFCKRHYYRVLRNGEPGPAGMPVPRMFDPCTVDGCGNQIGKKGAKGLCTKHYQMFLKTGDPCGSMRKPESVRFWEKVDVRGPDECWIWQASRDGCGYGMFKSERSTRAHQWAYMSTVGPIPEGLVLDHLCRTPSCVNPAHLEPVTNQENLSRGWGRRLRNGMATECINGHAYTPENTYTHPVSEQKVCKTCSSKSRARYSEKRASQ